MAYTRAWYFSSLALAPCSPKGRRPFHKRSFESGRIAGKSLTLIAVVLIVGTMLYLTFGQIVPPGYIGVRQVTAGPWQGFSKQGIKPGLHFTVPFFIKVHLVPRTIETLAFHREAMGTLNSGDSSQAEPDQVKALEVRTSDGLSVEVDVSVFTRFYEAPEEGAHGGPADLFTRVGISEADWDNQIRRVAADQLRQALGALMARQFYESPEARTKALSAAEEEMRKKLNPVGIRVESVLLRRYTYTDDRFDEAIFNKNIQEQEQRLKDASGKLAEVKAQLEQVEAEWDAKVETLRIRGENRAQVIRSEASLYENQKKAEADLLVAKAAAEVDRLKASALAQSGGANVYVARELAPLLASLKGGVVTGIDPYDVDAWAKRLGGTPEAARSRTRGNVTNTPPSAASNSASVGGTP